MTPPPANESNLGRTVAIVPMRGGSERVPGKNTRLLGDRPLFGHILSTLSSVGGISEIVVDSDSQAILARVADAFPSVTLVLRPPELGEGHVSMNQVLLNTLNHVEATTVVQVHSTSPFLRAATIQAALSRLAANSNYDSAFGVTRLHARFWDHNGLPMNHDPAVLLRTQDLAPVFLENSTLYVFNVQRFRESESRVGRHPLMIHVNSLEATDIDTEEDFLNAERIWNIRNFGEQ